MRIHLATDHAGLEFSQFLQTHLAAAGHEVQPGDRVHFVYVAHSDSARAAGATGSR